MKAALRTTVCVLSVLYASMAKGDGVCERGQRDFTRAERATMTSVLEAAKKALPPPPQGWTLVGDDQISVPSSFCMDYEGAWSYQFSRTYQRTEGVEARNDQLAVAAADLKAGMAKKQPRMDALMTKMQQLSQELAAAATKGDYARSEAINKELEKISAEYADVMNEDGTMEKANAAVAEAFRDVQMVMSVGVNPRIETPGPSATALPVPSGAQSAFRWTETLDGGVEEGHALVLIGPWTAAGDGNWQAPHHSGTDLVPARALAVRFTGDAQRLDAMLAATDFKALAAVLSQ